MLIQKMVKPLEANLGLRIGLRVLLIQKMVKPLPEDPDDDHGLRVLLIQKMVKQDVFNHKSYVQIIEERV